VRVPRLLFALLLGVSSLAHAQAWRSVYTDQFNYANGTLVAGNATWTAGNGVPTVASGQIEQGSTLNVAARAWYNVPYTNNQASCVQVQAATVNSGAGPLVRESGTTGAENGYGLWTTSALTAGGTLQLAKFISGSFSSLQTYTGVNLYAGIVACLMAFGTTLTPIVGGVALAPVTDASIASGHAGAVVFVTSGAQADAQYDNFSSWNLL